MEELLQNFTRLGMADIAFLIVNSKKRRSQIMFRKLDDSVSFPVYQETSDEKVWNVLGGGKDDMFLYDRCGRLVAYIPFPLSILERSFVTTFILHAYHEDPCDGMPCHEIENSTLLEDTENQNYTTHYPSAVDDGNYEQDNLTSRENEIFQGNEVNKNWPNSNETGNSRNNTFIHQEHSSSGNSSHREREHHHVSHSFESNSIWEIHRLDESNSTDTNTSTFDIFPFLENNTENETVCNNTDNCKPHKPFHINDINEVHDITPQTTTQHTPKRICVAEDENVCQQWSKKQLKRIQRCCTLKNISEDGHDTTDGNMCKSFEKKRCKKLKTVIKCCLKIHDPDENDDNMEDGQPLREEVTDSVETMLHNPDDAQKSLNTVP